MDSEDRSTQKDTSSSAVTSSPGHTPGPWDLTTRRGSWDWVVFQAANPNIEICQPFHDGTEDNELGEANARLIAAAPDLFEAVRQYIELFDRCYGSNYVPAEVFADNRAAMREALAKALPAI